MTSGEELQRLYHATLTGTPTIMALANAVYDSIPTNPFGDKTAYISFGPSDSTEDDPECDGVAAGVEITQQIDIWSRKPGSIEAKTLTDLVRKALHEKSLELSDNALVDTYVSISRVMRDPDGLTTHGVVQVTAMVEEPS